MMNNLLHYDREEWLAVIPNATLSEPVSHYESALSSLEFQINYLRLLTPLKTLLRISSGYRYSA